jgi:hypothetical protein
MQYYSVLIERTVSQWLQVDVEADSKGEAESIALEQAAAALDCEWENSDGTADDLTVCETELEGADNFGGQQQ